MPHAAGFQIKTVQPFAAYVLYPERSAGNYSAHHFKRASDTYGHGNRKLHSIAVDPIFLLRRAQCDKQKLRPIGGNRISYGAETGFGLLEAQRRAIGGTMEVSKAVLQSCRCLFFKDAAATEKKYPQAAFRSEATQLPEDIHTRN